MSTPKVPGAATADLNFVRLCQFAVQFCEPEKVAKHLETTKMDVDAIGDEVVGLTCLHGVAMNAGPNCIEVATILLDHGANPNAPTIQSHQTPLFHAIYSSHLDLAKLLISKGGDPKTVDNNGSTLLHAASQKGATDIVRYLLEDCKLDMNVIDKRGWKPYHTALGYGHTDIALLYISQGQEVNDTTKGAAEKSRLDPVHILVSQKRYDLLRLLKEKHGLLINTGSALDPMNIAVTINDARMVQLLVSLGANLQLKMDNETPAEFARRKGYLNLLPLLGEKSETRAETAPIASKKLANKFGLMDLQDTNAPVLNSCGNTGCRKKEKTPGEFKQCARCQKVAYCGKECQKVHWVEGGHRQNCCTT